MGKQISRADAERIQREQDIAAAALKAGNTHMAVQAIVRAARRQQRAEQRSTDS